MTDVAWGFLDSGHLKALLYADTVIYFAAMAVTVYLWTRYVILYLEEKNFFSATLNQIDRIFLLFELAAIAVNFFYPVLFHFDENAVYYADPARYLTLGIQILMFLLTSVYTLTITVKTEGSVRQRHRVIGIFGLIMTIFVSIQIYYPLMPLSLMDENLKKGQEVITSGMAEYIPNQDDHYQNIIDRADMRMYQRKRELKERTA